MTRFLALALPLVMLLLALFGLASDLFGLGPDAGELSRRGLERLVPLPLGLRVGAYAIEAAALLALFLLIQGRSGAWWLDGLVTAWVAWIFRGPLLVMSVMTHSRLPRDPWWPLAVRWLALYTLCGLALAIAARRLGVRRD